jgi:hypothetical protein
VISADYSDAGSGINTSSVALKIDGTLVDATITGTRASYTPAVPLANGEHHIEVNVSDSEGNQAHQAWSFLVEMGLPPGVVELAGKIHSSGKILEVVELTSADKKVDLKLSEGTTALTVSGTPPEQITIQPSTELPSPPADTCPIGMTYSLGPEAATFDPPLTLTFYYDEALLPEGMVWDVNCDGSVDILDIALVTAPDWKSVTEENFKIAYFDTSGNEWIILEDSTVNTAENTVSAPVSHFTQFAILGSVTEPSSAAFVVKSLEAIPEVVTPGEDVAITVVVTNTGETEGSYSLSLKIDGDVEAVEEVTLLPGEEREATFTVSKENPGSYPVEVGGKTAEFTVVEIPLPGEENPTNWIRLGGIVAAIMVIGFILAAIVLVLWRRHRAAI